MKRFELTRLLRAMAGLTVVSLAMPAMADESRVYIPMGSADSIAIIDTDSYQVSGQAQGVVNSHGSDLTPDGRFLVAGSLTPRESGETPVKPASVSADEHAAHHGGGGDTAASSSTQGTLYLIDTQSKEVVRQFEVPGPVHHVVVTADGRYAVSTHPMGGGISIVSLESGELIANLATGPAPNYMVQSSQDQSLYVSNSGNGTISEVDTENWFVRKNMRLEGSPEHMVLDNERGRLYANDAAGGQAVALDLESGDVAAQYPVGADPHGIDLSKDRNTLYATSQGDNRLVAVSLDDGTVREMVLAPAPYHLAINPTDGRLLISSRDKPQLWVVDPRTLDTLETVPLAGVGHQIAVE
ncbi:DNA-binding beta-propeller fold protein YncE [Modicisalibacter ilicicola DSM 19980]|uniref:DNA-binding beta-propeller fold protein YncE n=1 Tax=Modicisalibacter ilicicola DSM 19980 TaxID=1121942 RepID=A0A1M5DLX2_9GAMM|nr:PQQ-binding-like beta-propeller repeat protein [Halomonas ilicicola]SHF67906.1 DNA-binding beta-propeller fold protein YncE [Halomonas ilicicola DSM 19980]